jgi:fructose/tagatose bisphosphate aldolase
MTKEEKKEQGKGGAGLGLAIIAATAAAGYFLYGSKQGAKNRAKIKGWTLKAKGEVLEQMEKLKDVSEVEYNKVLDKVGDKYSKLKNIDTDEVTAMIDDMRKHWKNIQKQIEPKAKKTTRKATKVAKKAVNKAAKKVAKATAEKKSPADKK